MAAERQRWALLAAGLVLVAVGAMLVAALVGSDDSGTRSAPPASTPTSDARLTRLTARDFTIDYPSGWSVVRVDHESSGATYLDTTVRRSRGDTDHLLRVDVLPVGDPRAVADDALAALRRRDDFTLLRDEPLRLRTRSGDYDAIALDFLLGDIRSVDVLFGDVSGRVFAVLTRSPVSEHDDWVPLYEQVRASFRAT